MTDEAIGDGHTTDNIQIGNDGSIRLRAERSGRGFAMEDSCSRRKFLKTAPAWGAALASLIEKELRQIQITLVAGGLIQFDQCQLDLFVPGHIVFLAWAEH